MSAEHALREAAGARPRRGHTADAGARNGLRAAGLRSYLRAGGLRLGLLVVVLLIPARLTAQDPASGETRLQPGDMVRLEVGGEPHLNGDYRVVEGGVALLPLIGLVEVAGRRFAEVRSEIREGLGRELLDPEVVVVPVLRIAVLGEVRQPGLLPVDPTMSMADVIASAGGLTPTADEGKVMLVRDGVATPLAFGEPSTAGRPLLSGDQIVVGRRSWLRENLNVVLTTGGSVLAAIVTSLILADR